MSDVWERGNIKENFVDDENKVDIGETSVNLDCLKTEPNEGTFDFEEDNYSTQYRITLKYEDLFGESSRQTKIEEDFDNLIGFLDNDVIMENAMIKLKTIKEEDDGSFNNFHCRICKGTYKGYCLKCSSLLHILNNNMSIPSFEAESNTIPTDILEIRVISRERGVYLLRTLPMNIIFGPYEGILGIESTIGHSWKLIDNKLRNIKSGNWMKNIVCAESPSLKNLDIFQIDGNLYFQTNREITEGEELLIYYDDEELQQLDNSEECLYTPQKREKLPKIFACTICCLGFGSSKCLMEHKRKCRVEHSRSMNEFVLIECHYCKMWLEKWEYEEYHVGYCLGKHHRMWSDSSEGVSRRVEEIEGDCGTKDRRTYRRDVCSRPKNPRDKLKFNIKDYQCVSGGNDETRSNNEQTQNTIKTNNSQLHKNLNKHTDIKSFTCDICMMQFTRKGYLRVHIRKKHTDEGSAKDYKCSECSFKTNYRSSINRHLNRHKGIKPFKCDICMMKFTEKGNLTKHIKNKHTDGGSAKHHKCSECSFKTNHKSSFHMHLNTHSNIRPFQCDICKMKFNQKVTLKLHIKNRHTDRGSGKDYKCSECSYQTNYKTIFRNHFNTHRGIIKQYPCDICTIKFTEKCNLKMHIKNKHTDHGSGKDYKCSECSYQTNYKTAFRNHLNTHKGIIKQFPCDICAIKFTEKCNLKMHIKNKHTDHGSWKDYKCSECSFQTKYKTSLQRHLNAHKGIKPFTCDICAMKFTEKNYLKKHIKNKHADDKSERLKRLS